MMYVQNATCENGIFKKNFQYVSFAIFLGHMSVVPCVLPYKDLTLLISI